MLQEFLGEAVLDAYRTAIEQLDRQSAQTVLDTDRKLKSEVADALVEIIHRHTVERQVQGRRGRLESRLSAHLPRPACRGAGHGVEEALSQRWAVAMEKLARRPLPEGAEAWFAIPRWQALAPTYNEAVEMVLGVLAPKRKFHNRIVGRLGDNLSAPIRAFQAG